MKTPQGSLFPENPLPEEFASSFAGELDWRARLETSRRVGLGFAAPGGEFSKALFEAVVGGVADLKEDLRGERVVEMGAGMTSYGYALAAFCGAKNYLAVEPFYTDVLRGSISEMIQERAGALPRIPFKVVAKDMLAYLKEEEDDLVSIVACGIEDCILADEGYKRMVEAEIVRVLRPDGAFISSHSDVDPKGLHVTEQWFRRLANPTVKDRIRIYRKS